MKKKLRVVSGMRPTGRLHIGHLLGALDNWTRLQREGYECFFFVADWHAFTTDFDRSSEIPDAIRFMVADWLSVGVDPAKATIFLQSAVKEHAELYLLLNMITPVGWLERNPTFKEQREENKDRDLSNAGFLTYPVLQTADVIIYKGEAVPVGQDQVPHLELSREIVRRFNNFYGNVFPEPKALLAQSPKIMGIDGRKMSKSYGNAILLTDPEEEVRAKIRQMVTDPKRARRSDPGDPDTCNLFPLHQIFSTPKRVLEVRAGCTSAGIGCVDCKAMLLEPFLKRLEEIRARRREIDDSPSAILRVLKDGNERARAIATKTMAEVRSAMHIAL